MPARAHPLHRNQVHLIRQWHAYLTGLAAAGTGGAVQIHTKKSTDTNPARSLAHLCHSQAAAARRVSVGAAAADVSVPPEDPQSAKLLCAARCGCVLQGCSCLNEAEPGGHADVNQLHQVHELARSHTLRAAGQPRT